MRAATASRHMAGSPKRTALSPPTFSSDSASRVNRPSSPPESYRRPFRSSRESATTVSPNPARCTRRPLTPDGLRPRVSDLGVRHERGPRPGRVQPKEVERATDLLDPLEHQVAIQAEPIRPVIRRHRRLLHRIHSSRAGASHTAWIGAGSKAARSVSGGAQKRHRTAQNSIALPRSCR